MSKLVKGVNSLDITHPELAIQWHPTKNGTLRPEQFTAGSVEMIWWICDEGHPYPASINNRTNVGSGCPYCAGKKAWPGFNDLKTLYPAIAKEWHPTLNGELRPEQFTAGSGEMIWWICDKGHSYPAQIRNRINGRDCPYCAGRKAWSGFNDLKTLYPDIVKGWHPTLNGELRPEQFTAGSGEIIWWICDEGHPYPASIYNRTKYGVSCPYCAGRKAWSGFNDLKTLYPDIAKEWHPTLNGELRPEQFTAGSREIIWWICDKGHSYPARICNRTKKGKVCPYCTGRKAWPGFNDLKTVCSSIADEWHPTLNGDLRSEQFTAGSGEMIWWICDEGHPYPARIHNRTKNRTKCPYCTGRKAWPGYNDLESRFPDIVRDYWDYSKNKKKPSEYAAFSSSKVYWNCHKCGHSFKRSISSHVLTRKCPKCE